MNAQSTSARIENVVAAYNYYGDIGRTDLVAQLFTERGELLPSTGPPWRGRSTIARELHAGQARRRALGPAFHRLRHHVRTIEVTPIEAADHVVTRARSRSSLVVLSELGPDQWGEYCDTLVNSGDQWYFERRIVTLDGISETSWRDAAAQPSE